MLKRFPKPTHLNGIRWRGFFLFFLIVLVVSSMVMIVQTQHKIRHLESQYYQALQASLQVREEWGRLMLEKMYLTSLTRVENVAKSKLEMTADKDNYQNLYIVDSPAVKLESHKDKPKGD